MYIENILYGCNRETVSQSASVLQRHLQVNLPESFRIPTMNSMQRKNIVAGCLIIGAAVLIGCKKVIAPP